MTDTSKYKVLWTDGYDRESVADSVVAENLSEHEAYALCNRLQDESKSSSDWWKVVPQDAHVWRGMEEYV